jgi:hypothetical protein
MQPLKPTQKIIKEADLPNEEELNRLQSEHIRQSVIDRACEEHK